MRWALVIYQHIEFTYTMTYRFFFYYFASIQHAHPPETKTIFIEFENLNRSQFNRYQMRSI